MRDWVTVRSVVQRVVMRISRVGVYVAMFAQLDDSLVRICRSRSYWFGWEE